jgi:hypothetical protein
MGRKKLSPEQKWHEQAEAFKREAEKLPYGRERDHIEHDPMKSDAVGWFFGELQPPK